MEEGWIVAIGTTLTTVAGGAAAYYLKNKAQTAKERSDEFALVNAEYRLQLADLKETAHVLSSRVDRMAERMDALQEEHATCREELAAGKEREKGLQREIEILRTRIQLLEGRPHDTTPGRADD